MDFFAHLAGEQYALEFAIGDAPDLSTAHRAGVWVDGTEESQAMIDRMSEKSGGVNVNVIVAPDAGTELLQDRYAERAVATSRPWVTRSASHA